MSYQTVFCILEARHLPLDLSADGVELSTVQHGDLVAVVAASPKKRARPSRANLLQHQSINELILSQVDALLPMRFGIIANDEAAVQARILAAHAQRLHAQLDRVRNCTEYTLKAVWPDDMLLEAVRDREPALASANVEGMSMAERIALGKQVEAAIEALHAEIAKDLLDHLTPHAVDVVQHEAKNNGTSLDASFLLAHGQEAPFEAALQTHYEYLPQVLVVKLIGPMPAYSFSDITLSASADPDETSPTSP